MVWMEKVRSNINATTFIFEFLHTSWYLRGESVDQGTGNLYVNVENPI